MSECSSTREDTERETNLSDDNVRNIFEMLSEVFIEHEDETENDFGLVKDLYERSQVESISGVDGKKGRIVTHST